MCPCSCPCTMEVPPPPLSTALQLLLYSNMLPLPDLQQLHPNLGRPPPSKQYDCSFTNCPSLRALHGRLKLHKPCNICIGSLVGHVRFPTSSLQNSHSRRPTVCMGAAATSSVCKHIVILAGSAVRPSSPSSLLDLQLEAAGCSWHRHLATDLQIAHVLFNTQKHGCGQHASSPQLPTGAVGCC